MSAPFQQARVYRANVRAIPRSGIRDFFERVQGMTRVNLLGVGERLGPPWHIQAAI